MPAFNAAIEAHQKRITKAILDHALKICEEKKVRVTVSVVNYFCVHVFCCYYCKFPTIRLSFSFSLIVIQAKQRMVKTRKFFLGVGVVLILFFFP